MLEAQRGLEDYFRFYNGLRPHQTLGYRTPAEVFHGEQEAAEEESHQRGVHRKRGPNYWQENRDSHLTTCTKFRFHVMPKIPADPRPDERMEIAPCPRIKVLP